MPIVVRALKARVEHDMTTLEITKRNLLEELFAAFNRHDGPAVMACMTDDILFDAAAGPEIYGRRLRGTSDVRAAFEGTWTSMPDVSWQCTRHEVLAITEFRSGYFVRPPQTGGTSSRGLRSICFSGRQDFLEKRVSQGSAASARSRYGGGGTEDELIREPRSRDMIHITIRWYRRDLAVIRITPTYWIATAGEPPDTDGPVISDIDTDVAVVGSGYTGLACAIFLSREFGMKPRCLRPTGSRGGVAYGTAAKAKTRQGG